VVVGRTVLRDLRDDLGARVPLPSRVRRVVSLVPSLTEALASTDRRLLVGATDWCTHPADLDVIRVRGTKNPDVDRVLALAPDLVVANEEENRAADLDALRAAGTPVWVTAPRTVTDGCRSLDRMLRACGVGKPAWLSAAEEVWDVPVPPPQSMALVPIWRRPWMALGRDTFAGDMLRRLGVGNVLADAADRYPKVELDNLPAYDLVVLPDEPYVFAADDGPEAFPGVPCALASGRHLTWYGPSLVDARRVLSAQIAAARPSQR